ncbi:putative 40S ribosomal protein S8 [Encephalitozoon hellem ATCC 50504]|uniref:Ribosome biogenesis protein NSA2 homolog n=1 Tax=Encephalitozoon hellem TaxID=27973 RepID=A0A9Q9FAJ6_ENCHE|nr:putative 40S ribosomal protein S8 [Encephalitozoon hellem ATCC 50504]AFM99343.1 putative 40S ribosomal protein S8 [Encephalitozoon hellem ATCC 50504]UTX44347.1 ribosome biogenesis protein NSA2 [Encephalitozoon hellem]WEL39848.1 ribosome biogenesis protein NSA2 [Encephalitozoon hellem]|eukprot:XP_003888324.1 putative 40S ribosomal protein S8 [Encephalitozoon hellem ATCC 50504]
MPQNDFVERHIKKYGRRLDYEIKKYKKERREEKLVSKKASKLFGIKAKLFAKKQRAAKIQLKRDMKVKESSKKNIEVNVESNPLPHFLLDREMEEKARDINNKIKQQRQEKGSKYSVPLPKIHPLPEKEVFGVVVSGKRKSKHWKRMVTKPCFVGSDFTRKPPKYERFIRPMAMRFKTAHVSHPELSSTFNLKIIGLKKNPHSEVYTGLGILSKGTIIEVDVSPLGLVNGSGKIIWGKYAQITNNPENDGCVNAVLLV